MEKVHIATDRDGRRRGFAFVTFKHAVSVPYTIKLMDGINLNKRQLRLQSRTRSSHDIRQGCGARNGTSVTSASQVVLCSRCSGPEQYECDAAARHDVSLAVCPPSSHAASIQWKPCYNASGLEATRILLTHAAPSTSAGPSTR